MTFTDRRADPRTYRHWEGDVEADYIYTSGVAAERFFVELRDHGRILASTCSACGATYLPPRLFCERCFAETRDTVEVQEDARVAAFTVARIDERGEPLAEPIVWALLTFSGIEGGFVHRLSVPPGEARIGMQVRPVLAAPAARKGTIGDIESFAPSRGATKGSSE